MSLVRNAENNPMVKVRFENEYGYIQHEFPPMHLIWSFGIERICKIIPYAYLYFIGENVEISAHQKSVETGHLEDDKGHFVNIHNKELEEWANDEIEQPSKKSIKVSYEEAASMEEVFGISREELAGDLGIEPDDVTDWHYFEANGY